MKSKVIILLVVFSMLIMVNSSYAKQNESPMQLETNSKVKNEIVKVIVDQVESFSGIKKNDLLSNITAVAYDKRFDAYAVMFQQQEEVEKGWNLTVIYDKKTKKIVQAVKTEVNEQGAKVRLLDGQQAVLSKEEFRAERDKQCENCKAADTKPAKTSFINSLLGVETASAMSSGTACSWTSIVVCTLFGIAIPVAGWMGGLVCSVVSQLICSAPAPYCDPVLGFCTTP